LCLSPESIGGVVHSRNFFPLKAVAHGIC
jgi:hypothetical protein